jgi:hypothetical protein
MKIVKYSILALLMVWFFAQCNTTENAEAENNDTVLVQEVPVSEIQKIDYPLNNPVEISKMLNESGAGYTVDVTNSTKNIDKYMTEKDKALILGVYGADLAYVTTYNKSQETNLLFEVSKKLSEDLGISSIYNESTLTRIESNIQNKDSLHAIISNSFHATYDALQENGKGAVSVLVLAGGWIEGLYISLELTQNAIDKKKMMSGIAGQKLNLDKLLVAMDVYKENEAVAATIAELQKIEAIYTNINPETLTDKQMKELAKVTNSVRATLVK